MCFCIATEPYSVSSAISDISELLNIATDNGILKLKTGSVGDIASQGTYTLNLSSLFSIIPSYCFVFVYSASDGNFASTGVYINSWSHRRIVSFHSEGLSMQAGSSSGQIIIKNDSTLYTSNYVNYGVLYLM